MVDIEEDASLDDLAAALPSAEADSSLTSQKVEGLTRRFFAKVLAAFGVGELAHHITSGALPGPSSIMSGLLAPGEAHAEDVPGESLATEEAAVDHVADELIRDVQVHVDEGKDVRESILLAIDAMGTLNFVAGVRDLLPKSIGSVNLPGKPVGHINSTLYAIMGGLSVLKYVASDTAGKHHLEEETLASMKAFGIISGTIVAAEGLQLDLKEAYERVTGPGQTPQPRDQVAIMTMLGSLVSPVATTVGSASLIRSMSNDLAKTADGVDHDLASVAVSHISNLSGYLFFGDPPFIAICEKYGFQEGVMWQMKTMWPLALSSLFSSTIKLNHILARRQGDEGEATWAKAVEDSFKGMVQNLPIMASLIGKSLGNTAKYFTFADQKWAQDPGGIQLRIGEVMLEKLQGMKDLFLNDAPPPHMQEEAVEGLVHNGSPAQKAVDQVVGTILQAAVPAPHIIPPSGEVPEGEEAPAPSDSYQALTQAIDHKDFEAVRRLGRALGIAQIEVLVDQWEELQDNPPHPESPHGADHAEEGSFHSKAWTHLNPERIWHRATNVDRLKGYMGHNLGDVVNVFPFQAGSVPFLTPMFQRAVNGLDTLGLHESVKEMSVFFALMLFSMMADNYVACKIGLELLPNKPQIALIAAIQGGSMTAIGNMANVAQFNLDDYPLAASLGKMMWHADQVMIGVAWSQALGIINTMGVWVPPPVQEKEAHAAVDRQTDTTRRGFFRLFLGEGGGDDDSSKAA